MNIDKLFHLIKSLNKRQKANFTRYIKGKENTLPTLLYRRISRMRDTEEESILRVRKNEFADASTYFHARKSLANMIIASLAYYEAQSTDQTEFIRYAFLVGAKSQAEERLFQEMQEASSHRDFPRLIRYYDFVNKLQIETGIQITVPQNVIPYKKAIFAYRKSQNIMQTICELRHALKYGNEEFRKSVISKASLFLDTDPQSENTVLHLKVDMMLALLQRKYDRAYYIEKCLVDSLTKQSERYPISFLVNEIRTLALNAVLFQRRDDAVRCSMDLAKIEGSFLFERNLIARSRMQVGCAIAVTYGEHQVAKECLALTQEYESDLTPGNLSRLYFVLGLSFFYCEDFKQSIRCMLRSRQNLGSNSAVLRWEPQLLQAIASFEIGQTETIDGLLRSAYNGISDRDDEYGRLSIATFKNYFQACEMNQDAAIMKSLPELQACSVAPNTRNHPPFRIEIWINARISGLSIREALINYQSKIGIELKYMTFA